MPPRIHLKPLSQHLSTTTSSPCLRNYASISPAAVQAPNHDLQSLPSRYSPTNPPSHRDPTYRKSQLLRTYVSLLQTTPLIILFQHNNLKAVEWASIRRELATALQRVDDTTSSTLADNTKLTVIRTNILEPALRIAEYWQPDTTPGTSITDEKLDPSLTHALSRAAHDQTIEHMQKHPLTPLLTGPIALLTFPAVSPAHVKAALQILAPQAPKFPAPSRRANPGYHELSVQDGLKKLLLLGARIDGEVFDMEGVRWVGGIDGGIDGLRAHLVAMLQGFGAGVTTTLEAASKSLWFTVEGRRRMLEDEGKPATTGVEAEKKEA